MTRPRLSLLSSIRLYTTQQHLLFLLWLLSAAVVDGLSTTKDDNDNVPVQLLNVQEEEEEEEVVDVPDTFPIMYDNHWGRPQLIQGPKSVEIWLLLQESDDYMTNLVYVQPKYANIRQQCTNKHPLCTFWAASGECDHDDEKEEEPIWSK
jgi:hypothetical protein